MSKASRPAPRVADNSPDADGATDGQKMQSWVLLRQYGFWIDTNASGAPSFVTGPIHLPPAPFGDGERISFRATLAMGERVGNAGPDLFRSPIQRVSHARFPRCESNGAYPARCLEGERHRNHPQRMFGADRQGVRLRELECPVRQDRRDALDATDDAGLLVLRQDAARGKEADRRATADFRLR